MQSTQQEAALVHCPDKGLRHSQSHCVRNDIGTYSRRDVSKMSDKDRLWLLDNAFRAEVTYCHPHKEEYGKKHSSELMNFHGYVILNHAMVVSICFVLFLPNTTYLSGSLLLLQ